MAKKVTDEEFIERHIKAAVKAIPDICPMCGGGYLTDSYAGRELGICEVCYMRAKADAKRDLNAYRREEARYHAEREAERVNRNR